jgi:crotonobetainyl-CoA:carnitine CoA-transferase CaiB-like acyl-CoA transferase
MMRSKERNRRTGEKTCTAQDVPNAEKRHIRLVGQPVTLSRTPSKMTVRPPEFGEQTAEVLAKFGFGADEIAALRQAKVV